MLWHAPGCSTELILGEREGRHSVGEALGDDALLPLIPQREFVRTVSCDLYVTPSRRNGPCELEALRNISDWIKAG